MSSGTEKVLGPRSLDSDEEIIACFLSRQYEQLVQRVMAVGEDDALHNPVLAGHYLTSLNRTGRSNRVIALGRRLLWRHRNHGNSLGFRTILNNYAVARFSKGEVEASAKLFGQLLAESISAGDGLTRAWADTNLGVIADFRCDFGLALSHYHRANLGFSRLGNKRELALVFNNTSVSLRQLGCFDTALDYTDRSLDYTQAFGTADDYVSLLCTKIDLLLEVGETKFAQEMAASALELVEGVGVLQKKSEVLLAFARTIYAENPFEASCAAERSLSIARETHSRYQAAEANALLCQIFPIMNDQARALDAAREAIHFYKQAAAEARSLKLLSRLPATLRKLV